MGTKPGNLEFCQELHSPTYFFPLWQDGGGLLNLTATERKRKVQQRNRYTEENKSETSKTMLLNLEAIWNYLGNFLEWFMLAPLPILPWVCVSVRNCHEWWWNFINLPSEFNFQQGLQTCLREDKLPHWSPMRYPDLNFNLLQELMTIELIIGLENDFLPWHKMLWYSITRGRSLFIFTQCITASC